MYHPVDMDNMDMDMEYNYAESDREEEVVFIGDRIERDQQTEYGVTLVLASNNSLVLGVVVTVFCLHIFITFLLVLYKYASGRVSRPIIQLL